MSDLRAGGKAFWSCAGFTVFSALVSMTFSALAVFTMGGAGGHQHEYALYASSRSFALLLAAISATGLRSYVGVVVMALAMTLVQLVDAVVGFLIHNPGQAYGPLLFAAINLVLMVWMGRGERRA